ncbi:MAG: PQQ-binding-like beta-propeller repeat protein [Pirellulales bacterium]
MRTIDAHLQRSIDIELNRRNLCTSICRPRLLLSSLSIIFCCCTTVAGNAVFEISEHLGKTPALVVVVLGEGNDDLATVRAMTEQTPWTVFCRCSASSNLVAIRNWAREKGLLGTRVFAVEDEGDSLWLAGDMADAVWLAPGVDAGPLEKEIQRVLRPGGVAIAAGKAVVKPAQDGVDQWGHPYHGPDNNVVSQDDVARLPGELRFQTHPVFAPMPNQTLFAGGRIFFFSGHIAFHEREEPLLNTLTVLNAYNGLPLWSRPLNPKQVVHNLSKMATDSEVVFAEGRTLWILDAATGQERGRHVVPPTAAAAGDTDWKWIAREKNILWAAFGPPDGDVDAQKYKRRMGHWPWEVANDQYKSIVNNFGVARRLAAFRYPEMKLLWTISEARPFDARNLCMAGGRIFELATNEYMAARDSSTGETLWRHTTKTSPNLFAAIGQSLKRQGWGLGWASYCSARASKDVICIAGPSFSKTIGIGFDKGDLLWTSDFESPHAFFLGDKLHLVPRVGSKTATCQQLDPFTGKVMDEFGLGVIGSCTRLNATKNQFFYRPGGGEGRTVYVDINERKLADFEGIVRPGCFDGVVPANGRLYWLPLACDCWQVHGTFSMAPRSASLEQESASLKQETVAESAVWNVPATQTPATESEWPIFRANPAGTATVPVAIPREANVLWRRRLPGGRPTAPVCADGRVFMGAADGAVWSLATASGETIWQVSADAAVLCPPTYWNGRVVFGSCDGFLRSVDASDGSLLGKVELAPEKRFVNIMGRFVSAWPLGGGVIVSDKGVAYTAAGSTAADSTVAMAVDLATGRSRWRQAFTTDRNDQKLRFGVQANLLLKNDTLYINGGPPVGIVALDASTGKNVRIVARLEAGMEMFLEPDDRPFCGGPELFTDEFARTTIFKRHQGRVYFQTSGRHIGLIDGRLFCTHDSKALDQIVALMNTDPKTGGKMGGNTDPHDVMQIPISETIDWALDVADVRGVAVGSDGVVVLHTNRVEGLSLAGHSLWNVPLPAPPVRWGIALTKTHCVVTLTDGQIVCLEGGFKDH